MAEATDLVSRLAQRHWTTKAWHQDSDSVIRAPPSAAANTPDTTYGACNSVCTACGFQQASRPPEILEAVQFLIHDGWRQMVKTDVQYLIARTGHVGSLNKYKRMRFRKALTGSIDRLLMWHTRRFPLRLVTELKRISLRQCGLCACSGWRIPR